MSVFLSCTTYQRDNFSFRKEDKKGWINTFKSGVFYQCLKKEGYQNDTIFKLIAKKDLFNTYEGFEFNLIDSAKVLGKSIIKKMPSAYPNLDLEKLFKNS